jgi:dTDP-4-dehydrorhamnose 3,5-epimerase
VIEQFEKSCNILNVTFLNAPKIYDDRGFFRKVFSKSISNEQAADREVEEIFLTESRKGVVRGMHVQVGEAANYRHVFIVSGSAHDVIIDLRKNSPSYGQKFEFLFEENINLVLCLPPGVAHGFQSLNTVIMGYATTSCWQPGLDTGVNPLSIDIEWPLEVELISPRDLSLPSFFDWEKHLIDLEKSYGF